MRENLAVSVKGVTKTFKLPHEKQSSIKGLFVSLFRGRTTFERQKVLDDISFNIKDGEFFGIVGRNGSGKSTLLKLLAGIYEPNKGNIQVNGVLTPFIELGVGFNPELTGRENVFLNGALLGFDHKSMLSMYEEIVSFAELEKFMDQKLKNYSSGMQVRLAFSIAIRANGDILLLDEVLAVGDAIFQKKCYDYFKKLKKDKRTVVLVSHDAGVLQEYCERGILIEGGKIVKQGKMRDLLNVYTDILNEHESNESGVVENNKLSRGSGKARIVAARITDKNSSSQNKIFEEKQDITVEIDFKAVEDIEKPVMGLTVRDLSGLVVFQSNTLWRHVDVENVLKDETVTTSWTFPNFFNTGTYTITPAIADSSALEVYDAIDDMKTFKVQKEQKSHGVLNTQHEINITYSS
jgi:ABC-2 type transport system ATP-binding protein